MDEIEIEAVDREENRVRMSDGAIITGEALTWFDDESERCEPEDATIVVVMHADYVTVANLDQFSEPETLH